MDARRIRLQLELIRVIVRRETRLEPVAMDAMRTRALRILDAVEQDAEGNPQVMDEIAALRQEIR